MFLAATLILGCLAQDGKSPAEEALKKLTAELPKLIKAADADGNGTLNAAEFRTFEPAVRKAADACLNELDPTIAQKKAAKELKKFDKNADGKLDDAEKKAMEEDQRLSSIKSFDWDRDGTLNEREKTAMQWAAEGKLDYHFARADADHNKELSAEELSAALVAVSNLKIKKV